MKSVNRAGFIISNVSRLSYHKRCAPVTVLEQRNETQTSNSGAKKKVLALLTLSTFTGEFSFVFASVIRLLDNRVSRSTGNFNNGTKHDLALC
jgi:hypothetical protein